MQEAVTQEIPSIPESPLIVPAQQPPSVAIHGWPGTTSLTITPQSPDTAAARKRRNRKVGAAVVVLGVAALSITLFATGGAPGKTGNQSSATPPAPFPAIGITGGASASATIGNSPSAGKSPSKAASKHSAVKGGAAAPGNAGTPATGAHSTHTSTPPEPTNVNFALHRPASASSYVQTYVSQNVTDGNTQSYWESSPNAFPQQLSIDLAAPETVTRMVLSLPPDADWNSRTQTIAIEGSLNGGAEFTVAGQAAYTFNAATGDTVTVTFRAVRLDRVSLDFIANSGWDAAQMSEVAIYG